MFFGFLALLQIILSLLGIVSGAVLTKLVPAGWELGVKNLTFLTVEADIELFCRKCRAGEYGNQKN